MAGKRLNKHSLSKSYTKQPRKEARPTSLDKCPAWHLDLIDLKGPWGWENVGKEFFFTEIIPKIKNFEKMFWKEILNKQNHEVQVAQICKEAQKRLKHIDCDDIENLVSLRLSGTQRIWGFREDNIFKILWWDPDHQVYPSKKKHT
jgi:hypothetical protein